MSGSQAKGFTLVEVMVALAVMSMVMLATVSAFRTLGNTATTINKMTNRIDEVRSVSAFLRDAFENSVAGSDSGGNDGLAFGGSSGSLAPSAFFRVRRGAVEWRSKVLFGEAYGGSYFLRLIKEEEELLLQWQEPNGRTEPLGWDGASSRVILDDLEEFEVWTRMELGQSWSERDISGEPPGHVKLVVKSSGRYWPELIMQVQR